MRTDILSNDIFTTHPTDKELFNLNIKYWYHKFYYHIDNKKTGPYILMSNGYNMTPKPIV